MLPISGENGGSWRTFSWSHQRISGALCLLECSWRMTICGPKANSCIDALDSIHFHLLKGIAAAFLLSLMHHKLFPIYWDFSFSIQPCCFFFHLGEKHLKVMKTTLHETLHGVIYPLKLPPIYLYNETLQTYCFHTLSLFLFSVLNPPNQVFVLSATTRSSC